MIYINNVLQLFLSFTSWPLSSSEFVKLAHPYCKASSSLFIAAGHSGVRDVTDLFKDFSKDEASIE